ncbi:hypothetical protein NADE_001959 [Nannochloris sp. 'desiccata']|nr:hypothetical protein NADE_000779 [Chlorella desiccata (nom. nud.)]KAH7616862.1 hypothetical protein NADE_001669 [Chlorella desiccata (nom. nud.)]KAH7617080.1 hypothetical protein NADE_006866 [Chlorella desiccata (nom. nud.)]KAH7619182.1 hypothetical protein NADE_006027 [Chlorella desiccata (nom. nud.)]KAH7621300.1 hypothetical protein NADE_006565 [Chlorella desiccata (nom. nud.)]
MAEPNADELSLFLQGAGETGQIASNPGVHPPQQSLPSIAGQIPHLLPTLPPAGDLPVNSQHNLHSMLSAAQLEEIEKLTNSVAPNAQPGLGQFSFPCEMPPDE